MREETRDKTIQEQTRETRQDNAMQYKTGQDNTRTDEREREREDKIRTGGRTS